ncbi:hypothetical protein ACFOEK_14675 [Litoribrevibacter euphylliae]|uniref:Uncharacterized protein n=1 Tax=Litoribrevibacter euphylliae TaxID=1834034 RepID=A0ABV7HLQ2_9GAMM
MIRLLTVLLVVVISGCSNDFDKTCEFFTELSGHPDIEQMSSNDKHLFIIEKMDSLNDGDAKAAWQAIAYAVPEEKYSLFQQVAIESGAGDDWNCPQMESLAPLIKPETYSQNDRDSLDAIGVTREKDADFEAKKSTLPVL